MSVGALLLLVAAGIVHSGWNLLAKTSRDKQAFLWLALVASVALFAVPFVLARASVPPAGWLLIGVSGALEAVYYVLLGSAYEAGDLSLVYPLSRGSAPLFVLLFALAFLHEHVTAAGVAGILLTVGGMYCMHLPALSVDALLRPLRALGERTSALALLTGLVIACYSTVDKKGLTYVAPLPYLYLIFSTAALLLTPYILRTRRAVLGKEWRANRFRIVAVAVMFVLSYLLVLIALRGAQVSYVSAVRGLAVVFAAVLGITLLREPFARMKLWGSLLLFAGIACIELAG
jgi:drug/metabolite transporter (DMT)-like permease